MVAPGGIGSVWESYADLGRRPRSGYVPLRFTSRDPQRVFQKPREKGTGGMTASDHHLPDPLKPGQLATAADSHLVPALIADAGEPAAAWPYIEFFTANIRNPNTRRAYVGAVSRRCKNS